MVTPLGVDARTPATDTVRELIVLVVGEAARVEYQDYRKPEVNTICDIECRDEGMLVGLQEYIDEKQEGDIIFGYKHSS